MWVLIWIAMYSPIHGLDIMDLGVYESYDDCMYEMREAEISINRTNEGMLCLEIPRTDNDYYMDFPSEVQ